MVGNQNYLNMSLRWWTTTSLWKTLVLWPNDLEIFLEENFGFFVFWIVFIIKDTFITFCQHSGKMHFLAFVNIFNKNALMLSNSRTKKILCIFFEVNLIVFIKILWLISANWWFLFIWIPYWLLVGLIYPDLCLMIFVILWFSKTIDFIKKILNNVEQIPVVGILLLFLWARI